MPGTNENATTGTLCEQCPWRKANHGKRTPGGFFARRNLRRLWNQIRRGEGVQGCHLTDPAHPDHVKAGTPLNATARECTGAVVLVHRELQRLARFAKGGELTEAGIDRYLAVHGDGFTREGLLYYLFSRDRMAGTPLGETALPTPPDELLGDNELIGRLDSV